VLQDTVSQAVGVMPQYADPDAERPTTFSVIDNLTSTSSTDALSANQGRVLDEKITAFANTEIVSNTDLNSLTTPGLYDCKNSTVAGTLSHCPVSAGFAMIVLKKGSYASQMIHYGSKLYTREKSSAGWGSWYVYNGTAVS